MASQQAQRRAAALCKTALPYVLTEAPEAEAEDAPIVRELAPGLLCGYLVDRGDHYEYLQLRHLTVARMSEDDLHQAATRNLIDRVNEALEMQALGDGAHGLLMGGDFEASLMVAEPLWEHSLNQYVSGDFVVAVPARDVLAFSSDTPAGVSQLQAVVERAWEGGENLLTRQLYRRTGGAWRPY